MRCSSARSAPPWPQAASSPERARGSSRCAKSTDLQRTARGLGAIPARLRARARVCMLGRAPPRPRLRLDCGRVRRSSTTATSRRRRGRLEWRRRRPPASRACATGIVTIAAGAHVAARRRPRGGSRDAPSRRREDMAGGVARDRRSAADHRGDRRRPHGSPTSSSARSSTPSRAAPRSYCCPPMRAGRRACVARSTSFGRAGAPPTFRFPDRDMLSPSTAEPAVAARLRSTTSARRPPAALRRAPAMFRVGESRARMAGRRTRRWCASRRSRRLPGIDAACMLRAGAAPRLRPRRAAAAARRPARARARRRPRARRAPRDARARGGRPARRAQAARESLARGGGTITARGVCGAHADPPPRDAGVASKRGSGRGSSSALRWMSAALRRMRWARDVDGAAPTTTSRSSRVIAWDGPCAPRAATPTSRRAPPRSSPRRTRRARLPLRRRRRAEAVDGAVAAVDAQAERGRRRAAGRDGRRREPRRRAKSARVGNLVMISSLGAARRAIGGRPSADVASCQSPMKITAGPLGKGKRLCRRAERSLCRAGSITILLPHRRSNVLVGGHGCTVCRRRRRAVEPATGWACRAHPRARHVAHASSCEPLFRRDLSALARVASPNPRAGGKRGICRLATRHSPRRRGVRAGRSHAVLARWRGCATRPLLSRMRSQPRTGRSSTRFGAAAELHREDQGPDAARREGSPRGRDNAFGVGRRRARTTTPWTSRRRGLLQSPGAFPLNFFCLFAFRRGARARVRACAARSEDADAKS